MPTAPLWRLVDCQFRDCRHKYASWESHRTYVVARLVIFLLSRRHSPTLVDRLITNTQVQAGFAEEHACHSAVYISDNLTVEATPWRGVIIGSVYDDLPDNILRVRRRTDLTEHERFKMVVYVMQMLRARYSVRAAVTLGMRAIFSPMTAGWWSPRIKAIICSKVFLDAFMQSTRNVLKGCEHEDLVMPAHLSETKDLKDILIPWARLSAESDEAEVSGTEVTT
jgi:hypothetical protein